MEGSSATSGAKRRRRTTGSTPRTRALDATNARLDGLTVEVHGLTAEVQGTNKRLDRIDTRLARVEDRMEGLEAEVKVTSAQLAEITTQAKLGNKGLANLELRVTGEGGGAADRDEETARRLRAPRRPLQVPARPLIPQRPGGRGRMGYPAVADMAIRVLLIDDDVRLHELLASYLEQNGLTVTVAADGRKGLAALEGGTFDAVLLDLMMPGLDGIEVCKRVRQKSNIPIVMLTAKGDETDRVVGLELGADDYVAKPFSPRELLARLRAVLRRARPDVAGEILHVGDIGVDVPGRVVTMAGKPVDLTGIEFDVVVALVRRAGRVVARDALLSEAGRGDVVVGERTVDVHVSHLRQKLGDDPRSPRIIKTVRGVGYVLAKDGETEPAKPEAP